MAAEEESPSPQAVSDAFVAQYYGVLEQAPEQACRFYVENSVVSRPGPDGAMMSFKSVEAINEQLLSADYKSSKYEIISIDAQNSSEKGVFVVVIGSFTGKDKLRRKFSQAFYLACQDKVYVILNDILRHVDGESAELQVENLDETAPTTPSIIVPVVCEMTEPADAQVQTEPVHTIDISVEKTENGEECLNDNPVSSVKVAQPVPGEESLDNNPVSNVKVAQPVTGEESLDNNPVSNVKVAQPVTGEESLDNNPVSDVKVAQPVTGEEYLDDNPVSNVKVAQPVTATTVSKSLSDTTKRSFASIVQSLAQNPAPFQVKASTGVPKLVAQPRAVAKPKAPATVVESENKTGTKNDDEPGTSIFVRNLPMSATPSQVHEVFKKFGPIKQEGIQVRSYKQKGICFGFVAFESASSVQDALQAAQASPIILGDRTLTLKEKLANYEGSKPSGRNRNGSANDDGFKRQSNFNKGRRYSRKGYERQGDVPNTDGNQEVNQNGGDEEVSPQVQDGN